MPPKVFTGRRPFNEFTTPVIILKIMDGERPTRPQEAHELGLTDSMWGMTVRCWHQDPAQRPTMTEVIELLRELLVSSLSIEADLNDFLQACKTWEKDDQEKKAQELADRLDEVRRTGGYNIASSHYIQILDNADFHQRKRRFLRRLQKLCSDFNILPTSFMLPPASVEQDTAPFASGNYSEVFKATLNGRSVVIKVLNVTSQSEREKLHRVNNFGPQTSKRSLTLRL